MKKNIAVTLGVKEDFPNKAKYSYYNIANWEDLKIPREEFSFAFVSYSDSFQEQGDTVVKFHSYLYLVGSLINAKDILKDISSYDLLNSKSFRECVLSSDGEMVVFNGSNGKKKALANSEFIKIFPNSEKLVKAVREFVCDATVNDIPKTYCKRDVK